ncbi:hypothetical protein DFH06DRAFT_1463724 [Mycena polygramma]|nr:hypothetical protein DFH06DRAFT_1463724 [Mycena polygramma]
MSKKPIPFLPPNDLPHFPTLRTLKCEAMDHAPSLLEQLKPSLVEFTLVARGCEVDTPTKRGVQELYSALATNCNHSSLQRIVLQRNGRSEVTGPHLLHLYLVSGEELKPLFCFRNLLMVSLSHTVVDLDDELPSDRKYRINPRVTLEGLYAFAKYCPNLKNLEMLFDATIVPELKIRSEGSVMRRVPQDSLANLEVAYSPIGNKPRRVAKFLRTIFPCLETIRTSHDQNPIADAHSLPSFDFTFSPRTSRPVVRCALSWTSTHCLAAPS